MKDPMEWISNCFSGLVARVCVMEFYPAFFIDIDHPGFHPFKNLPWLRITAVASEVTTATILWSSMDTQHYISKGKSAEIFHEGKTLQNHNFSFKTFTFLPLPSVGYLSHYGLQLPRNYRKELCSFPPCGGKHKHHFLLELPWPPWRKHTHTALTCCAYCNLY